MELLLHLLIKILFKINYSLVYIAPSILIIINPYFINIIIVLVKGYLNLIAYFNTLKKKV